MKKTFLIIACALFLVSCNNDNLSAIATENQQAVAIQNFKSALKSLNMPENRPSIQETKAKDFPQMSDRRKELLVTSAKALIKSTGVDDSEISNKTREDKSALINWALDIYIENSQHSKN